MPSSWAYCSKDCRRGRLFVAELDPSEDNAGTSISTYKLADLVRWYDRAVRWLTCDGDALPDWPQTGRDFGAWGEAFMETER